MTKTNSLQDILANLQKNTPNKLVYSSKLSSLHTKEFFTKHSTFSYSLKRILISLICLFIGITLIFLLVRYSLEKMGINAFMPEASDKAGWSDDQKNNYYHYLLRLNNLDGNIFTQIFHFWYNIIPFIPKRVLLPTTEIDIQTGKLLEIYTTKYVYFGVTMTNLLGGQQLDVAKLFNDAIPYSFVYGIIVIAFSYFVGIPLGIIAAIKSKKMLGKAVNSLSLFIYSIPSVIIIMIIFVIPVGFFHQSSLFASDSFFPKFWPALTMCILFVPVNIIMTRKYFIEEKEKEYVVFAYSKGLTTSSIFFKHIFRNTCVVILRTLPIDLGLAIFGFSVITETQWNIPGVGHLLSSSLTPSIIDPMIVLTYITLSGVIVTFASLFSDLIMIFLDPRIKLKGDAK